MSRGVIMVAVALLAGCTVAAGRTGTSNPSSSSLRSPAAEATTELAGTPPQGPAATEGADVDGAGNAGILDFTAATLDGGELRGGDHAGRDVVLWMWSPW